MEFYKKLSSIGFLKKSYAFKFLFVAFIGIHIPLIGILFFVLYSKNNFSSSGLLVFSLVMTLLATVITLILLKKLIQPLELASRALNDYKLSRTVTKLPLDFSDEVGLLLSNIQDSISESEKFITEKQNLVYLLSHDLRTFAGNPKSLATMILESNPSENVKELAQMICQSSDEQFQYIEKFVKMLKEQDEMLQTTVEVKEINLKTMVDTIALQLGQSMAAKKIELIRNVGIPSVNLKIDAELLTRVIFNLLHNAIKFSFSDSKIQLDVFNDKGKIVIQIIDQGVGFDSKDNEKVFAKFTKMSRLGTSDESSTGIGLYLCRQIIEKNQGTLTASSEGVNKGATFSIVF